MTTNPSTPPTHNYDAQFDLCWRIKWQVAKKLWAQYVFANLFPKMGQKMPIKPLLEYSLKALHFARTMTKKS